MTGMPAIEDVPLPNVELVETDSVPLESDWHRDAINFLIAVIRYFCRGRTDYYVAGNMFIYFSEEQARNRDFRGPDFFFVDGVPSTPQRPYWAVWLEGGRYPNLIIELLSKTTAEIDRTVKKDVYESTFKTYEYFCYDPDTRQLEGWRLIETAYEPILPDDFGRLECRQLGLWLGGWQGKYQGVAGHWLRFFDGEGNVVLTFDEAAQQHADAVQRHADTAQQRAEAAEAEAARLKAQLDALQRPQA